MAGKSGKGKDWRGAVWPGTAGVERLGGDWHVGAGWVWNGGVR